MTEKKTWDFVTKSPKLEQRSSVPLLRLVRSPRASTSPRPRKSEASLLRDYTKSVVQSQEISTRSRGGSKTPRVKILDEEQAAKDARDSVWALVLQHEGLLINFIARHMAWTLKNQDLFDVAKQEGRLLVRRAIERYDGSSPIVNWICSVLSAQLRHRVRESEQKDEDEPVHVQSIDRVDEQHLPARASPEKIEADSVRRAVRLLLEIVRSGDFGPLTARAVVHSSMVRVWGDPNLSAPSRRRAIRYGARPADLDAVLDSWKIAILDPTR